MAISLVQTNKGNGGGYVNTYSLAFLSAVGAGNLLVLTITAGDANTIGSIVDNRGNTWSLAGTASGATGERKTWLYYAANSSSGSTSVTVTFGSGEFADSICIVREYSGIATTSPLDVTTTGTDGSSYNQSHSTSTSAATSQAVELVVAAAGSSGSTDPVFAAGSGYGNLTLQAGSDPYTYGMLEDLASIFREVAVCW